MGLSHERDFWFPAGGPAATQHAPPAEKCGLRCFFRSPLSCHSPLFRKDTLMRQYSRKCARLQVEELETRLAPATLLNNILSYTDVDGDAVMVTTSKGAFTLFNPNGGNPGDTFTLVNKGLGQQLRLIDLTNGTFAGANLMVTAKQMGGRDGLGNVGYINSTGFDLGVVGIQGDLGRIDAGDNNTAMSSPGLVELAAFSLGRLDTSTQAGGGNLVSNIQGFLPTLFVVGDVVGAEVIASVGISASGIIGSVTIGGSLI